MGELMPNKDMQLAVTDHTHSEDCIAQEAEASRKHACAQEDVKEADEEFEWVVEDFFDSGVLVLTRPDFRHSLLPQESGPAAPDPLLAKAMEKYHGMKSPKPDFIYALRLRRYPILDDVKISVVVESLLTIVPLVNFPWFFIEGEFSRGTLSEAENQVCRAGAVLVNTHRLLLDHIGEREDVKGSAADEPTFVFSAALCPSVMEIRVHWAEVNEKKATIFHMHEVASESLADPAAPGKLREIIHNILDWGCRDRFEDIKKTWDKIYNFERKMANESISEHVEISTSNPT